MLVAIGASVGPGASNTLCENSRDDPSNVRAPPLPGDDGNAFGIARAVLSSMPDGPNSASVDRAKPAIRRHFKPGHFR